MLKKTPPGSQNALSHPSSNEATLVGVAGPNQGETIYISKSETSLGRAVNCDVTIAGALVSRNHAVITYENNHYMLYDHNSTNGTWVNGQRISQHILKPNDRIQIGPTVFVLHTVADETTLHPQTPTPRGLKSARATSGLYTRTLGDYELLQSWSGGMAVVYKAKPRPDGNIVALKVLQTEEPYVKDKFIKEIEVGKTLRHPHIVKVLGGGQQDGQWFMVMEFMDNETLADHIEPNQPAPLAFTKRVIGEMCDALSYAHQRGVYHRDIKPANILFNRDNTAKLGDFGIARLAQAVTLTAQGAILGTPRYMSYEQAAGKKVDHRSDLYSLGVVLYQLLTGQMPFQTNEPLELINCHLHQKPTPPRDYVPTLSPQLEAVVLRALTKNRDERFQNADEMAAALGYTTQHRKTSTYMSTLQMYLLTPTQREIKLRPGKTVIGRDLVDLNDTEISRIHAHIIYRSGRWWIEDVNSTNGTFVNGQRIFEAVMLQADDEVMVGTTTLTVVLR